MKEIILFLLLTGVIWTYGLQSPEECNESISYAGTLPPRNSPQISSTPMPVKNQATRVSLTDRNRTIEKESSLFLKQD